MYDELIAELRQHHCDAKEDDTQEVCEECAYDVIIADKSVPSGIASVCVCGLMHRAADAIEELSRENGSLAKSVNEASESLRQRRPVVLCRDCVHFSARSGGSGYCGLLDIGTSQEAFCSHGENEE